MNIATINPFRYRGYYFDTESNFYYLQSRYYDPVVGRFICADAAELLTTIVVNVESNLFTYCQNEPVNKTDYLGLYTDSTWNFVKLMVRNLASTKIWKYIPFYGAIRFYKSVRDNGVWDYKRSNRSPQWAKNGYFYAFGCRMTTEQLGNFNFGFTGASMGFSPATLFAGGGYVAIKHGASWEDWLYYFDSKEDHKWIALGILAYSVFDAWYTLVNNAFRYALEKVAYTICLSIYKNFR